VVLTPRRWRQVGGGNSADDGGKQARLTGEITKETVKTIARGMPGVSGVTVVTTLVCFFYFACEAAGAHGAPGIPCALLLGDGFMQDPGGLRRGNAQACPKLAV
jgi:hypothetical protein